MTTIATDGRSMAGDGLVTSGDHIFGWNMEKVRRLTDGRIVGSAGSVYDTVAFVAWLENGGDKPKLGENFEALVLYPDGRCESVNEDCRFISEEAPTATGSGRMIAIGAMEVGASPEVALGVAAKRNAATGGRILVLHLEDTLRAVA